MRVSSERLHRIGEVMKRHIDEHHIAAAVTLVARKGKVVHLAAHGLADAEVGKPMTTLETFVARLAGVPLDFQPGSEWSYGGLAGIDTLAPVVEVASGQPFGEFVQDRIFTPLGMNDTTILHGPDEGGDRLAAIHRPGPDKVTRIAPFLRFPKRYSSGAGGLISKAED